MSAHSTTYPCQLSEMNFDRKYPVGKYLNLLFFKYEQQIEFDEVFASSSFSIN